MGGVGGIGGRGLTRSTLREVGGWWEALLKRWTFYCTGVEVIAKQRGEFEGVGSSSDREGGVVGCLFWCLFRSVFRWCFGTSFCTILVETCAIWEPFGRLFIDILEVFGVLLDATHSKVKIYISRFWRSQVSTCWLTVRLLFQVWISECGFNVFYSVFCYLGSPLGSLLSPFGHQRLGDFVTSLRIGEKVASWCQKSYF